LAEAGFGHFTASLKPWRGLGATPAGDVVHGAGFCEDA